MIHSSKIFLITGLIALLAACSNISEIPEVGSAFIAPSTDGVTQVDQTQEEAAIIAELTLDNGNTLRFIDEGLSVGGESVGMLEVLSADTQPVMRSIQDEQATPLEVFLALRPYNDIPDKLLSHHEKMAVQSDVVTDVPRILSFSNSQLETQDGGVLYSWCPTDTIFRNSYLSAMHYPNNFKNFGFGGDLIGKHYGVTGKSKRRALSVCNHKNANSNTGVSVWSQVGVNSWAYVAGTSYNLNPHRGMWYASQSPAFLIPVRYRAYASGGYYSIAGSWD